VDPSPCLRVCFGCWLLAKFQMRPRYDIEYYGADLSVLLMMGTLFWQNCNWPQRMVLCGIIVWEKNVLSQILWVSKDCETPLITLF
jgi:hypothetical protein